MDNERMILAIGRIERALSRIEAAKDKLSNGSDNALEERHSALKLEMQQAIETIDGLIAKQEH